MSEQKNVVIAQCTDEKRRGGPHRAVELYDPSDLFTAQRRYAEAYADRWFILSAKYGLIHPIQRVSWYDMEISEQHSESWQESVEDRVRNKIACKNATVEVIAGGDYLKRIKPYLERFDIEYQVPFDGQRYGTRVRNMIEEARKVENESLSAYAQG